jgi:NADPH-dependent ferric siderophore reductase
MTNPTSDPRPDAQQPAAPRPPTGRQRGTQYVFAVVRCEQLSPHLVRIHLGGPAFDEFVEGATPEKLAKTDKYVKLLLPRRGVALTPPYDLDALRADLAPEELPVRRTYTVRSVDTEAKTIAIDFVVHGDEGVAGPWAAAAEPGDLLAISGIGAMYSPPADPDVTALLIGDEAAIPAIAAALEAMDATAKGIALIEVEGPDDELALQHPAGVEVRWIHRGARDTGSVLVDAVAAMPRPSGAVDVFAHGERTAMKRLRATLQDDWGIERRAMSLSAYWALGRAEDAFQAEKSEPVGAIFAD